MGLVHAQKKSNDIDDIFANPRSAASKQQQQHQHQQHQSLQNQPQPQPNAAPKRVEVIDASAAGAVSRPQRKPKSLDDDLFADSRAANSKYTDDGLKVYYADDLKIGEGEGDTDLCPFDCNCCF